jgi:type VI secretion system FHA domain protein
MPAVCRPTCGAPSADVIALRVTRRPGATEPDATAFALPPEGLTIGRSVDCGLVLSDPLRMVSRRHAQVLADGQAARVRCVSSGAPLWVNDVQLDPGDERSLFIGDRLRIGRFELAVEPAWATAAQRPRLDRWFDLDGALDPLAAESPLPALAASPEAEAASAVVSWQTSRHVVRTVAPVALSAASVPPAPLPVQAPVPVETRRPLAAAAARSTPPAPVSPASASAGGLAAAGVRPAPGDISPAQRLARRAGDVPPELHELRAAFARGAGLGPEAAPLTPEWMEHLGALLRATAEGTLALLQSRAVAKRHMRAEVTHIAPRQNNPLKFSPDATEALTRMLQRDPSSGFLDPVAALHDAHHDLLVHQVAMVAGMRAAVFELFSRLGPEAAEKAEGPAHGISRLPLLRAAALWQRHRLQHAQLLEHLDDDFETIFGREFLRAYEAQSLDADANPTPPEAPWPNGR